MYIPRKVVTGKHYAEYKKGIKTKAATLKEALGVAKGYPEHVFWIDFIPGKFTLQLHGWFKTDETGYVNLKQVQDDIRKYLKAGKDPGKHMKGKWHYDLRIQKATAPTWFGLTPFRAPWTGTITNKVLGTVKGYQVIAPGGAKLQKFLMEVAEKSMAKEGIAERRDRLEWMRIKSQWFPPDSPGNPQKFETAAMVAIEFYKPCCIHRRELDFVDCTFFGDYLKGRFYNRLVERKMNADEMTEWQKKDIASGKAKAYFNLSFYFWKSKSQWGQPGTIYSMDNVYKAALGKKVLDRLPAPGPKPPQLKGKKVIAPEASKEFH